MNRRLKILRSAALLLAGAAALVSCGKDDIGSDAPEVPGANGDITLEIGFAPRTRVSTDADFKSAWKTGDEIGVFAVRRTSGGSGSLSATAANNYINNVKLTYTGTSWTAATPLYYPPGTDVLDFYAYYPYDANANDPTAITFNVKNDQSGTTSINSTDRSNYSLFDLLTAKSDNSGNGYGKSTTSILLKFSHALAMVQVSVPSGGKGFGPGENLTVTLRGVKPGAALNLSAADGTTPGSGVTLAATNNDAVNITMYRVEQPGDTDYETSYTYRALVPAQEVAQGKSLFWFEHEGRQLLQDGALAQAVQMTAGRAETFERTLPATLIHTVFIPKGTFQMGSPASEPNRNSTRETQHEVTLTKDFRMGKYTVTFAQYDAFCEATNRNKPGDNSWGRGDRPVINVSWNDAVAYCDWLTQATGIKYSLPTEAQWEYACRGGQSESLPFGIGDGTKLYADMANFYGTYPYELPGGQIPDYDGSNGHPNTIVGRTTTVGSYPYTNGYGLYDMHGNVFEWCSDWYANNYGSVNASDPATDPAGAVSSGSTTTRVLRGGDRNNNAQYSRSAFRNSDTPDSMGINIGFRVAVVS